MKTKALLLLVLLGTLPRDVARAQAPVSPAERRFRAWLAAFNPGDRAVLLNVLENEYASAGAGMNLTIHRLLTHTGGKGDFFGSEFDAHRLELQTLQDHLGFSGRADPPGSRWAYRNYGMLLLGVIIGRVSGASYYDHVRDNIYKPAGMAGTGSLAENAIVPDRSIGYMKRDGVWKPNTETLPYRGHPRVEAIQPLRTW